MENMLKALDARIASLSARLEKREFTPQQRDTMARAGHAMPDGSYPIGNVSDLHNAIQAIGRAKNINAVKVHIKRRAKELGAEDQLPEGW